jgi:hypothetical protein
VPALGLLQILQVLAQVQLRGIKMVGRIAIQVTMEQLVEVKIQAIVEAPDILQMTILVNQY